MKVGIRFCGGCNPRYDRGAAYETIKAARPEIDFSIAEEGEEYDMILLIGGCSNCCPSYDQFVSRAGIEKMWELEHIDGILQNIDTDEQRIKE